MNMHYFHFVLIGTVAFITLFNIIYSLKRQYKGVSKKEIKQDITNISFIAVIFFMFAIAGLRKPMSMDDYANIGVAEGIVKEGIPRMYYSEDLPYLYMTSHHTSLANHLFALEIQISDALGLPPSIERESYLEYSEIPKKKPINPILDKVIGGTLLSLQTFLVFAYIANQERK